MLRQVTVTFHLTVDISKTACLHLAVDTGENAVRATNIQLLSIVI